MSDDIAGDAVGSSLTVLDAARDYVVNRKWAVVPVPHRKKGPLMKEWQKLRLSEGDLPAHFHGRPMNVGILLGEPSDGLVDIDLDSPEAVKLADEFLPRTDSIFGRPSKPRSHRLYVATPIPKTERFEDIDATVLVEVRSTGGQTIFPPSVHPSGELISFEKKGEPVHIDGATLRERVARLATATLLLKQWPKLAGSRQEIALALAGGLLGNGWNVDEAKNFIHVIARMAGDNEAAKRAEAALSTEKSLKVGENVTGLPRLAALIGDLEVNTLARWLNLRQGDQADGTYRVTPSGLVWDKPVEGKRTVPIQLTNFTARITADISEDDGAEVHRTFEVDATLKGRQPKRIAVSAEEFGAMSWPMQFLGAQAVVYPGIGLKDHARAAIQVLSDDIVENRVFTHTGWRLMGGEWAYLHGRGAIGPNGPLAGINVKLPDPLSRFVLPDPPNGEDLKNAVRASLRLLGTAPDIVTFPVLAAIFRAVIGGSDFSLHLLGPTGVGKSEVAALAQQHFGSEMDARHLPGSWSSTANALEGLGFAAKDTLLIVDDFAPHGSQSDVQRQHREADRLLRAQGNRSSRLRMRADTSLREPKPPRCLVLSTGEEIPFGESLQARFLSLDVSPGAVVWELVTDCQRDAAEGLYAEALAGFVRWLAPRYNTVQDAMRKEIMELRLAASRTDQHRRTIDIVANLTWALNLLLCFGADVGAVTQQEADDFRSRGRFALETVAGAQSAHQRESDPVKRFIDLLRAAIASGRAHIADVQGNAPDSPGTWGWRRRATDSTGLFEEWIPQGDRVGWLIGEDVYIEQNSAARAVQQMGGEITAGPSVLRKRFKEQGLLASVDQARETLTVRRKLQGATKNVLHLKAETLAPALEEGPGKEPPSGEPPISDAILPMSSEYQTLKEDPTSEKPRAATVPFLDVGNVGFREGRESRLQGEGEPPLKSAA